MHVFSDAAVSDEEQGRGPERVREKYVLLENVPQVSLYTFDKTSKQVQFAFSEVPSSVVSYCSLCMATPRNVFVS